MTEPSRAVFLSYASQDAEAARHIADALRAAGVEVWFDQSELRGGDVWDRLIRKQIHDCVLFVPIISSTTQGRLEGYFRREWKLAVDRTHDMAEAKPFLVPVVIDNTKDQEAEVPELFRAVQWTRLPEGETPQAFVDRVLRLLSPVQSQASAQARTSTPSTSRIVIPSKNPAHTSWRSKPAMLLIVAFAVIAVGYFLVDKLMLSKRVAEAGTASAPSVQSIAPALSTIPVKSIAVLPFVDMSEKKDQEYFADGMSEQILDLLAKIPTLKVIARTSSFQFKGKAEDVRVVAEKLGVATVLEGSVRKAGDRLRITAQLIRASDATHLWSEVYDRQVRDVFRTQDEIADAVVAALKVSLLGAPAPRPAPTSNSEAYNLYLQGLAFQRGYSGADSARAQQYFERALALDPKFAEAWAALASAYSDVFVFGAFDPSTPNTWGAIRERIATAANRAIALDPKSADAHVALANLSVIDFDYAGSEREVKTALELEPDDAAALNSSIFLSISRCRLDEAEQFARRLIARDPLSVDPYRGLATALWFKGHAAEAEGVYRQALAFQPNADSLHYRLSQVLLSEGRAQEALNEAAAENSTAWQLIGRIMALDALGRRAEANQLLQRLESNVNGWWYQVAQIYARRRNREQAFQWLEQARRFRDPGYMNYLKCDPWLRELRADPRYQKMLSELNPPP
jgi:TolB-like protein/Flp pilus assembly protein TadD